MATAGALRSWPRTTRSPFRSVKRSTARAGFGIFFFAGGVRVVGRFVAVGMWAPTLDAGKLAQPGDEDLHHEVIGPRLLASEVEVGFGQEGDRPLDLRTAELAALRQRLLGREGAALEAEHRGGVLLVAHARAVESQHLPEV